MSLSPSSKRINGSTRWLLGLETSPRFVMRLFCFPYAGAGASIYRTWATGLPRAVNVCPVQLPGRENRINEAALTEMATLIPALAQELLPSLTDRPFAFFGHSMGALISFELTRYLRREHGLQPSHLFISGRGAPQLYVDKASSLDVSARASIPESTMRAYSRRLKNSYGGAFEDVELRRLLLPTLSADLSICNSYAYTEEMPLDCPFSIYSGSQEKGLDARRLNGWRELTNAPVSIKPFPGDHFFLNNSQAALLETMSAELSRIISTQRLKNSAVIFAPPSSV